MPPTNGPYGDKNTAGFNLNFFHKGKVDTRSERAVHTGPHTDPAEGRIVDGDAVCNVEVFETRGAGDRRILHARPDTRGHTGREVKEAAYTPTEGNLGVAGVQEFGMQRSDARVHG